MPHWNNLNVCLKYKYNVCFKYYNLKYAWNVKSNVRLL